MSLFSDLLRFSSGEEIQDLRDMFIVADGGELSDSDLAGLMLVHWTGGIPAISKTLSGRVVRHNLEASARWNTSHYNVVAQCIDRMTFGLRLALQTGDLSATGMQINERLHKKIPVEYWSGDAKINWLNGTAISAHECVETTYYVVQVRGFEPDESVSEIGSENTPRIGAPSYDVGRNRGRPRATQPFVRSYVEASLTSGIWRYPDSELARELFKLGLESGWSHLKDGKEVPTIEAIRTRLMEAYQGRDALMVNFQKNEPEKPAK